MSDRPAQMFDIQTVLQRCDPALLAPCDEGGELDPAAEKLLFLQDRRRVQKVLWRQLFVLDSTMHKMEGLESAQQLLTQPCPPQPEGGARGRWKVLKAEYRLRAEQMEETLATLQQNIQTINNKRHKVTQLLQQLQAKKKQSDDMEACVQKAHKALQACDGQLIRLRAELDAELGHVDDWLHSKEALQTYMAAVNVVAHVRLLSYNQSEVSLELWPHPPANMNLASNEPERVKLSIIWNSNNHFTLQVDPTSSARQLQEAVSGHPTELSAALLEVVQNYMGQADLLAEIQSLRYSFAIDWHPAQRVLVYLKSASILCHLEVQEGYPDSGAIRLRDIQRDGQPMNTAALQPQNPDWSLSEWLIFLCSNPLI
ncbi:uncharacterized protein si:dkey-225f5.4 isoform X1 [Phyllopteryx taeniolatus]|uniref:uncharacterized protein si:dkey-225f5.4 isoform X1 n=1 Tax=Phyllopteryx taeniolatus TaxID=161469 RepID=UPI002AD3DF99|nr:uncharacterized protein si:dkey-225f5.4 isoform X1 [Phyllopteryx taeniolatus]